MVSKNRKVQVKGRKFVIVESINKRPSEGNRIHDRRERCPRDGSATAETDENGVRER
jgi:hypothetical protein